MAQTREGNLTNTPPVEYVRNQINLRQRVLGQFNNIPPATLNSYNNRGVFARICSAIELDHDIEDKLRLRIGVLNNRVEQGDATATDKNELFSARTNANSCATSRLRSAGFDFVDDLKNRNLSKSFIIQGTVVKNPFIGNDSTRDLEGGLGSFDNYFGGLYGWGSLTEDKNGFGYAPPPGITSVSVKYLNKGAVTESTINVKLYNKRQFQLFDVLYLRPGFSLLLEFGWTQYLHSSDSTKIVKTDLNTEAFNAFFEDKPDKEKVFAALEQGRKISEGNYDGVFGIISNFNWTFNEDGTYDCSIKMFGHGSVIEGMQAGQQSGGEFKFAKQLSFVEEETTAEVDPDAEEGSPPVTTITTTRVENNFEIKDAQKSALGQELYGIIKDYGLIQNWGGGGYNALIHRDYYLTGFKDISGKNIDGLMFKRGIIGISLNSQSGYKYHGDEGAEYVQNPIHYMQFGAFLALLQSRYLLYSSERKSSVPNDNSEGVITTSQQASQPLTGFDFNFVEKNENGDFVLDKDKAFVGDGLNGTKPNILYYPDNLDQDQNFMLTAPGIFSADSGVCLISYGNVTAEIAEINDNATAEEGGIDVVDTGNTLFENLSGVQRDRDAATEIKVDGKSVQTFKKTDDGVRQFAQLSYLFQKPKDPVAYAADPNNTEVVDIVEGDRISVLQNPLKLNREAFLGRIANIYVNMHMLIRLAGQATQGGKLSVNDFLQSVLNEIQGAFGNINQLTLYSERDGLVKIQDLVPNINKGDVTVTDDKKPIINIFGVEKTPTGGEGSFVKKFNISGNIPKDLMNQIIIGSTATGDSITANATGLAGYNRGLKDIFKEDVSSALESINNPDKDLTDIFQNRVYQPYKDVYNKRVFTSENLNALKESAKTFFRKLLSAYSNRNLVTSTFLPFDMSLEIDGLSGFTVFNALRVNEDVLPVSYQNQGTSLMLSAMDQQIDDSGWKTTLSCITFSDPGLTLGEGAALFSAEGAVEEFCKMDFGLLSGMLEDKASDTCVGKQYTGIKFYDPAGELRRGADINIVAVFKEMHNLGITNSYIIGGLLISIEPEGSFQHKAEKHISRQTSFKLSYSPLQFDPPYHTTFQWAWGGANFRGGLSGFLHRKGPAMTIDGVHYPNFKSYAAKKAYFGVWAKYIRRVFNEDAGKTGYDRWKRTEAIWANTNYGVRGSAGLGDDYIPEERRAGYNLEWEKWDCTTPEGQKWLEDDQNVGYKYRGLGLTQFTGASAFDKMDELLMEAGVISKPICLANPYLFCYDPTRPREYDDTFMYPDTYFESLPDNPLQYINPGYTRNDVLIKGTVLKQMKRILTSGGFNATVKNGQIRHNQDLDGSNPQLTQDVLNQINCIDEAWLGTCLGIFVVTGTKSAASKKWSKYTDKKAAFEEEGYYMQYLKNDPNIYINNVKQE